MDAYELPSYVVRVKGSWEKIKQVEKNCILLPKLSWPTVRKKCCSDWEKLLKYKAEGHKYAKILRSLKVSWFQNVFMKSSFGPKYQRKIW